MAEETDGRRAGFTAEELIARGRALDDARFEAMMAAEGAVDVFDTAFNGQFRDADRDVQKGMVVVVETMVAERREAERAAANAAGGGVDALSEAELVAMGRDVPDALLDRALVTPGMVMALESAFGAAVGTASRPVLKGMLAMLSQRVGEAGGRAREAAEIDADDLESATPDAADLEAAPPPEEVARLGAELPQEAYERMVGDPHMGPLLDEVSRGAIGVGFADLPEPQRRQIVALMILKMGRG